MSQIAKQILANRAKNISAQKKLLQSDLKKAVEILTKHYQVKRIILFGSMISGKVNSSSDVDIIVEGLGDHLFKAVGHCFRKCKTVIDIKPFEDIDSDFRTRVLKKGRVVYESKK